MRAVREQIDGLRHDTDTIRHPSEIGPLCASALMFPMATEHLHLNGMAADHAEWTVDFRDDDFDASALERAMVEARRSAYSELSALDAA